MKKLEALFILSAFLVTVTLGCTKSTYVYQVIDLPEPTLERLGEWIVKLLKKEREEGTKTCYNRNYVYLRPFEEIEKQFDSEKMAGIFMHQFTHSPKEVFTGIEDTEQALRNDCTFNLIIRKDMDVRRFMLKNMTDDSVFEVFMTEKEIMDKMSNTKSWESVDVLTCTHYLYHLGTNYGRNNISVTVVDKNDSDEEMRFSSLTPIGGFYKKGCDIPQED